MNAKSRLAQPSNLANMEAAKKDLIYLYCVTNLPPHQCINEGKDFGVGVDFVYHQGIYAVVSKVKESEFSEENLKENLANFDWIKAKANIHEKIIEGVMKGACVIPFKFGTIFNTEDNLKTMLEEHIGKFKDRLKYLDGKEEWGVKIYCDTERLRGFLTRGDKEILEIDKEISSSSPGKAFLLKKKKAELLSTLVNKKINEYGQDSFERLSEQSLQTRINKLLPKEVTERKDDMILNSAFLVDKNKVGAFISMVDVLKAQYGERGLFFDCTGPWPPYNFCDVSESQAYRAKRV